MARGITTHDARLPARLERRAPPGAPWSSRPCSGSSRPSPRRPCAALPPPNTRASTYSVAKPLFRPPAPIDSASSSERTLSMLIQRSLGSPRIAGCHVAAGHAQPVERLERLVEVNAADRASGTTPPRRRRSVRLGQVLLERVDVVRGTVKNPPVNGFLYRSPHTAMTPLFFSVSIMQSSSLMTGNRRPSRAASSSPAHGCTPMPTTHGRRPSLIDDRWRASSTTMPLPAPPARLNSDAHDRRAPARVHALGERVELRRDLVALVVLDAVDRLRHGTREVPGGRRDRRCRRAATARSWGSSSSAGTPS